MEKAGKVYLVGAGPGDPGLITHKGLKLLQSCDAVIYDRLVSDRLLDCVKEGCVKIYVGKTVGSHAFHQEEINRIIIEKAFIYPVVVRLKGGDPFVFGRGGEEVLALKEKGIPFEIVPGVTSAIAAAAYAGIPITHRGSSQSFTVITGHTTEEENCIPEDLKTLAQTKGTIVILMGIGNLDIIRQELLAGGRSPDTPVAVVSNGTTPEQKEVRGTLEDICHKVGEAKIKAPAVIVVGNVAELDMKATIRYPLSGVRVGVTGTREIRAKLMNQLEELGAYTTVLNALEVVEYGDQSEFDSRLTSLKNYEWIVFTSNNTVRIFFEKLSKHHVDHRSLAHIRFAAVGSQTGQALWQYGYQADLIPEQYSVTQLAKELCSIVSRSDRLLIPRAKQGSEELIEILSKNQIQYDDFRIYDVASSDGGTEPQKDQIGSLDYLTFASSSGVHAFFNDSNINFYELLLHKKIVCIGEATTRTLKEYGYNNVLTSKEATVKGLVDCILEDYTNNFA